MLHYSMQTTIDSVEDSIHRVELQFQRDEGLKRIGFLPLKSLIGWVLDFGLSWYSKRINHIAQKSAEVCFELRVIAGAIPKESSEEWIDDDGLLWEKLENIKNAAKSISSSIDSLRVLDIDREKFLQFKKTAERTIGVMAELNAAANHLQWVIAEHDASLYHVEANFGQSSKEEMEAALDKLMKASG